MHEERHVSPTSNRSAICKPIELDANESFRVIFQPTIIDNPNNEKACIKGKFIKQRKGSNDEWENIETLPCTRLQKGEEFSLLLSSKQIYNLFIGLKDYKTYFENYGIPKTDQNFIVTGNDAIEALGLLSKINITSELIDTLLESDLSILRKASDVTNTLQIRNTISTILCGLDNCHTESWWQKQFREAPWVLSQLFSQPVVIGDEQAHVGGKSFSNKQGKLADYLYHNSLTNNVALIEIKRPDTLLLHKTPYRDGIYRVSEHISGSVSQLLEYRDSIQKEYATISLHDNRYKVFNPRGVIIIGNTKELDCNKKTESFELFRSALKDIEIVTFDELVKKCEFILELLDKPLTTNEEMEFSYLESPLGDLESN